MGKGKEWSDSETVQLCRSWLETSEDPIRGTGQKRNTFVTRLYNHWLEHKSEEDTEDRTVSAVGGRWKKLVPEVTKFCGIYGKVKSKERSGWNDTMYLESALKIYEDHHKQPFEYMKAWEILHDKPKWIEKLATSQQAGTKRKATAERPMGRKAAKNDAQVAAKAKKEDADPKAAAHLRFVAASEKKARVMEEQFNYSIFMQDPQSAESKAYFSLQRKRILANMTAASEQRDTDDDAAVHAIEDDTAERQDGDASSTETEDHEGQDQGSVEEEGITEFIN